MITIEDPEKIEVLKILYKLNGGLWSDKFNLAGIRNPENHNKFNDTLIAATNKSIYLCKGTTDPGRNADSRGGGANYVVEGFYSGLWTLEYSNKYGMVVFKQSGKITTIDDKDRNHGPSAGDTVSQDKGAEWGIWGHSTKKTDLSDVDSSSWGCQVWKDYKEFIEIVGLAQISGLKKFSYLLMRWKECENGLFYLG